MIVLTVYVEYIYIYIYTDNSKTALHFPSRQGHRHERPGPAPLGLDRRPGRPDGRRLRLLQPQDRADEEGDPGQVSRLMSLYSSKNGKGGAARFEGRRRWRTTLGGSSFSFDLVAGAADRWRQRR